MNEHKDFYEKEYMPRQHKIGKFTGYLGTVLCFAPALVLGFLYHCWPNPGLVLTSFITAASSFAFLWFIEPISYYPIVGPVGTYMAFISGNISNMRVPCASMAQIAADVEPGTEKGGIIATIGMGVSVLINVSILTLGVIAGTQILSMLPAAFTEALNYLLPALFGALFVQFAMKQKKLSLTMLCIGVLLYIAINAGIFDFLPGARAYLGTLVCVFSSIAIGIAMDKSAKKSNADAE